MFANVRSDEAEMQRAEQSRVRALVRGLSALPGSIANRASAMGELGPQITACRTVDLSPGSLAAAALGSGGLSKGACHIADAQLSRVRRSALTLRASQSTMHWALVQNGDARHG